jgi:hypothetical protein
VKRLVLFVALAAIASGAAAPSAQRTAFVPRGVSIGGIRVGGLGSEQARGAISWWYNRPLRFVFYGKRWSVHPAALGASVDADWAVGTVLKAKPGQRFSLRVNVDQAQVQRYVRAIDGRMSVEAVDATATLRGLQPVIGRGKSGIELGLFVPWMPTPGAESPIQRVPSGFPGPGGTGLSPRAQTSWVGGYHQGLTHLTTTWKRPAGVG